MRSILLLGTASVLTALPLSAQSISINFGANQSSSTVDNAAKTTGAIPLAGNLWNNTTVNGSGSLGSLIDDSGTATSAFVDWTANNTWQSGSTGETATSENGDLTKGYFDDGGGWTVELSSPYLLNDIYIIHATDQANPATMSAVSVNGTFYKGDGAGATVLASGSGDSWSAANFTTADTLVESDNYIKVLAQPGVNLAALNSSPGRAAIAGLQVENAYTGTLSYWDIDGATAGAGGGTTPAGNWADANWSADSAGTSTTANWTSGNAAVFSAGATATGAYTVTLAGTENADAVWVQNGDVTLTGGTLALGSTGLLRSDGSLTVDSALTATALTTTGSVTLNSGSNNITGQVTINGTTTLGANQSWNKLAGTGTVDMGANTLSVGDATDSSFGGTIQGSGSLTKTGSGRLTLSGVQSGFTGSATVNAGTLAINGGGTLNWDIGGSGDFAKTGSGQLTVLSDISTSGNISVADDILQVGNVGTAGSIGNPSSITLTRDSLALRYRLSGADATLDSSSVTFENNSSQLRQHAGTAADKLTITNTTIAGTTTDGNGSAVQGVMSTEGGNLVFGTGTTAAVREVYLKNGNVTIESGADLTVRYFNIGNGSSASGIVNQTGGDVTMEAGSYGIRIGHWGGSGRQYNLSGGTLDATGLAGNGGDARYVMMGWDGEGDMTVGGGAGSATLKAAGLKFDRGRSGAGSSASTISILTNGVAEVGSLGIAGPGDNDGVILSGGLLRGTASTTWASRMEAATGTSSTIDVGSGIATTQSNILFGSGDIAKTGAGTFILGNAANTHTGALAVNAGTLHVNGGTTSVVTVNNGATIQGGTPSTAGTGTVGSLTLNNGSKSTFRLGGSPDQIDITGTDGFTVTSGATHTAAIVPAGQLAVNDEFVLFDYVGTAQGDGAAGITATLPNPHYAVSVNDDTVNTQIKLKVDSIDSVIWTGAGGSTWDVENTTSWKLSGGSASDFYEYDSVIFDNTSPAGTVTLSGTINPATVSVNSTNSHTLTGSGISGAGSLTKDGSGTLTLTNNNSYTGTTDLQSGIIEVGNGGALGSGDIALASGTSLVFDRTDTGSVGAKITGAGEVIKRGSGTLVINNNSNTFSGGLTVEEGRVDLNSGKWSSGSYAQGLGNVEVQAGAILANTATHAFGGSGLPQTDLTLGEGAQFQTVATTYVRDITMTGASINPGTGSGNFTGSYWGGTDINVLASTTQSVIASNFNTTGYGTHRFNVDDSPTLATDLLVSGVISGGSVIQKNGAGRMVSSGTNTASGNFVITAGRLAMTGDNSGRSGGYEVTGGILEQDSLSDAAIGTGFLALKGGTLEYNGTGAETTTRALWIDGAGTSGTFDITNAAANLTMAPASGTMNQEVIKNGAGTLTMQGVISGAGLVTVNDGTMVIDATQTYTGGTSVDGGTLRISSGGNSSGGAIRGTLTINDGGRAELNQNDALGYGSGADSVSAININDSGVLERTGGANETLGSVAITMDGGTISAASAGMAYDLFGGGTSITANNATAEVGRESLISARIDLRQTNSIFTVNDNAVLRVNDIGDDGGDNLTKEGIGTMIIDGDNLAAAVTNINAGTLVIGASGSIANSTNIIVDATATFDVSAVTGFTVGATQTLSGPGTVLGDTAVDGTVAPGNSPGTLNVTGDLDMSATSLLDIEIAGKLVGEYDQLDITGDLTVDGTIALTLTGYNPILGDTFDLVDANNIAGTPSFDYTNAALDPGLSWDEGSFLSDGVLTVIPEPGAILLIGLGGLGFMMRRRRS